MRESVPAREQAGALSQEFALIPVCREILADMLTPVRAYALLCPPGQPGFLLETVEGGERLARYSFIGFRPEPFHLDGAGPLGPLQEIAHHPAAAPAGHPPLPRRAPAPAPPHAAP